MKLLIIGVGGGIIGAIGALLGYIVAGTPGELVGAVLSWPVSFYFGYRMGAYL